MMMFTTAPDLLHFVPQRGGHGDCTVATIAMLTGVDYEWALVACSSVRPNVLAEGLTITQIRKAIKLLGFSPKMLKAECYDPAEATGILHVYKGKHPAKSRHQHAVILWAGRVIDGGGELWMNLDDYLTAKAYKAGSLIVLDTP